MKPNVSTSSSDVFYVVQTDPLKMLYLSSSYAAVWERPPAELLEDIGAFHDFVHPDDRDFVLGLRSRQASGLPVELEYRILTPGGGVRWIHDRCYPIDMGGRQLSAGIASDVTQRKRAELAEIEQRRLLELVALGRPLEECLTAVTAACTQLQPAVTACILMADRTRGAFEAIYSAHADPAFRAAMTGSLLDPSVGGTCAAAAVTGEIVTSADIAADARWHPAWGEACIAFGMRACYSQPVFAGGAVAAAVLTLCFKEPREADEWDRRVAAFGAALASLAIERDRAARAVAEDKARLALALKAGALGVHEYYPDADILLWDERMRELWGVGRDEAITYEVFRAGVHPEDLSAVETAVARALKPYSDGRFAAQYRVISRRSGVMRWVAADGEVRQSERGRALVGTVRDITGERESQEQLRRSEARLRALADAMPHIVWVANAAGRLEYFNARRHRYCGVAQSAEGGWSYLEMIHPEDQSRTIEAWEAARREGRTYSFEHRLHSADGTWRWHVSRAEPERDPSGAVVRWYGAATDIHDLKQAEEELRALNETLEGRVEEALAQRKLLADIVDCTDAFVVAVDPEYRVIAINAAAQNTARAFGGVEVAIGDNLLEAFAGRPEIHDLSRRLWGRALAGENFSETVPVNANGRTRWVEMRFSAMRDQAGAIEGVYVFGYDITQRMRDEERLAETESRLRQAQKLEALGQLTGGVAHDFNNLLMALSSGLTVLDRTEAPERRAQIIESMRQAVERGAGLTRHLLSFSRRRALAPEALDLSVELGGMADMLQRSLRGDIELQVEVEPGLWPVEIDRGEFELAVLNLCVNARDAMPLGGRILIRAGNAAADGRLEQDAVHVAVIDEGEGMALDVQARAFEPFFTTKETGKGSGLGLAQVYGFVSQSGGRVRLESAPGRGAAVTMEFPRAAGVPAPSPLPPRDRPAAAVHEAAQSARVLLVEDDSSVAEFTRQMLESLGYEVVHAPSAAVALATLGGGDVDVVLSDVMMPGGMNGADLALEIRRCWPQLPVILATGYPDAVRNAPPDLPVLAKPYGLSTLARALAAALALEARNPPPARAVASGGG